MKKIISILLTICLIFTTLSSGVIVASAAGTPIKGTDIKWIYNTEKCELTFSGKGAIPDYTNLKDEYGQVVLSYPWAKLPYKTIVFGEGITGIGSYSFHYSTALQTLSVPDTVKTIGEGAFFNCLKLENADIKADITALNAGVFSGCKSLTGVVLPDKCAVIGEKSFYNCRALESVKLPKSLKTVGAEAFSKCISLPEITLPDKTEQIGEKAFYSCEGLVSVSLGSGLKEIGMSAFDGCTMLKEVNIPEGVRVIDMSVFTGCEALEKITLPFGLEEIKDEAFSVCPMLTAVTVPVTVKKIGVHALGYGKLSLPVKDFTVTGYEGSAAQEYAKANNMKFVSLGKFITGPCGENVTWSFDEESKVLTISGTGDMYDYSPDKLPPYAEYADYTAVVIDETVTGIGAYAFYGKNITEYTFHKNISKIGEKAFGFVPSANAGEDNRLENVTVSGYKGTAAEKYASDNGFAFVSLDPVLTGPCGENAVWTYDEETKILTVSGTGAVYDYSLDKPAPFADKDIVSVTVCEGITELGTCFLTVNAPIQSVTLGKSITEIRDNALGFYRAEKTEAPPAGNGEAEPVPDDAKPEGTVPENTDSEAGGSGDTNPGDTNPGDTKPDANTDSQITYELKKNETFVITGYSSTPADEYAKLHSFTFNDLDPHYPDISFGENVPFIADHENNVILLYSQGISTAETAAGALKELNPVFSEGEIIKTGMTVKLNDGTGEYEYRIIVVGDISGDGNINSSDALAALQHSVDLETLEGDRFTAGDIDNSGKISSTDALIILQIAVGSSCPEDYAPQK